MSDGKSISTEDACALIPRVVMLNQNDSSVSPQSCQWRLSSFERMLTVYHITSLEEENQPFVFQDCRIFFTLDY